MLDVLKLSSPAGTAGVTKIFAAPPTLVSEEDAMLTDKDDGNTETTKFDVLAEDIVEEDIHTDTEPPLNNCRD